MVLEKGKLVMRAPTPAGGGLLPLLGICAERRAHTGSRTRSPPESAPFCPVALRVRNPQGHVVDTVRSVEPIDVEIEYRLDAPITGLRVGIYLLTTHGEQIFTSFDTDDQRQFERYGVRPAGHYVSRCTIPADLLNEGRYIVGRQRQHIPRAPLLPGRAGPVLYGGRHRRAGHAVARAAPGAGTSTPGLADRASHSVLCGQGGCKMTRKATVKRILGELPLTAEVYWQLRQNGKPLSESFSLRRTQKWLPAWRKQAEAAARHAPPGAKMVIFATLRYWIEHAALLAMALAGQGHQVTLAYLPYANWRKAINRFDLRRQNGYSLAGIVRGRALHPGGITRWKLPQLWSV